MKDLLSYENKRVIVSGCASGMGLATTKMLLDLGAEVHGLDYKQSDLKLHSFKLADLRDPSSIDHAVNAIGVKIDALFNCAGLGPTFSPLDIMKVNFIGTRYLTERIIPLLAEGSAIASISSTAAMGWSRRMPVHMQLLGKGSYEDAVQWSVENAEEVGEGYSFSKEAVVVWTMVNSQKLIKQGIRINCVLPGLTSTPMLTDQIAVKTSPAVLDTVMQPMGRPAQPEEQAAPLIMLNSAAASYVNGVAFNVDGGRMAGVMTSQIHPSAAA